MMDTQPVLYILARSDLASMNAGKLAAQCCHAANDFTATMDRLNSIQEINDSDEHVDTLYQYNEWLNESEARTFGTTIILDGIDEKTILNLNERFLFFQKNSGIIVDDTYPVRDGQVTHLIPLITCMWVFAEDRNDTIFTSALDSFNLYP